MRETREAIEWNGQTLSLLDQRRLPGAVNYIELDDAQAVAEAISDMVVRGAPAIGIAAAYGAAMSVAPSTREPLERNRSSARCRAPCDLLP